MTILLVGDPCFSILAPLNCVQGDPVVQVDTLSADT